MRSTSFRLFQTWIELFGISLTGILASICLTPGGNGFFGNGFSVGQQGGQFKFAIIETGAERSTNAGNRGADKEAIILSVRASMANSGSRFSASTPARCLPARPRAVSPKSSSFSAACLCPYKPLTTLFRR
jgi:hypothetical protein